MSVQTFHKALNRLPLSHEERDMLTVDELFVLILARRLNGLTWAEQRRMAPGDLHDLTAVGLIGAISDAAHTSHWQAKSASPAGAAT